MALINFYGKECPHCIKMEELAVRLEKEEGVTIERKEVWHDEENMKELVEMDRDDMCGGIPFFINTETGKTICGEGTYEELKSWALDK